MDKINESQNSQEDELLLNMYNFYKKRYTNQSEMESKFNAAVEDLIETTDISKVGYVSFCVKHDIEPAVKTKAKKSSSLIQPAGDPCSRGGSVRSGC